MFVLNNIRDFFSAALPWLTMGIVIAIFAARGVSHEKENEKTGRKHKMKKTKIAAILYYLTAVLFDLAALVMIFYSHNINVGLVLLCVGSAMLCFGGALANRYAKEQQDDDTENGEMR